MMPAFENYGGHEYSFLNPLKKFAIQNNLELIYLLPKNNLIKLDKKNYKILYLSKKFFIIKKILSTYVNFLILHKFFNKYLKKNDLIYLDGFSIYFLISFILFYFFSKKKKINVICWLRYPINNSIKDLLLKMCINKILKTDKLILLTENNILKKKIKMKINKIKLFSMPSLHNLSKYQEKKIKNKYLTMFCPGIYREEKYGANLIEFLKKNIDYNFRLKISKNFLSNTKFLDKDLKKKLILIKDNLSIKTFIKEVNNCDLILLPYKMPDYLYRTSGIFFESISLKKISLVSSGTLMAKDLERFNLKNLVVQNWKTLKLIDIVNILKDKNINKNLNKFSNYYKKINGIKPFVDKLDTLNNTFFR